MKKNEKEKEKKVDKKLLYIEKAVDTLVKKGYSDIKTIVGDYEEPKSFKQVSTDELIQPNITAIDRGRKHYFEVVMKSEKKRQVVSKLKFMSYLAANKSGSLILFAPRGHKMFTQEIVEKYQIDAKILSI